MPFVIEKHYEIVNDSRYRYFKIEKHFSTLEEAKEKCKEIVKEKSPIYGADLNLKIYSITTELVNVIGKGENFNILE